MTIFPRLMGNDRVKPRADRPNASEANPGGEIASRRLVFWVQDDSEIALIFKHGHWVVKNPPSHG